MGEEHTFSQLLSNEAVHVKRLRLQHDGFKETIRATRYHQDALVGIRTELEQSAVTDGILGTVAGFLIYAVSIYSDFTGKHAHGNSTQLRTQNDKKLISKVCSDS